MTSARSLVFLFCASIAAAIALSCGGDDTIVPLVRVDGARPADAMPTPSSADGSNDGGHSDAHDAGAIDSAPDPCAILGAADASVDAFAASNFDPSSIDASAAVDLVLSGDARCTVDTTVPSLTCGTTVVPSSFQIVSQPGGGEVCVLTTAAFTETTDGALTIKGSRPLIIDARGAVDVAGLIDVQQAGDLDLSLPAPDYGLAAVALSHCGLGGASALGLMAGNDSGPTPAYGSRSLVPLMGGPVSLNVYGGTTSGGALQITSATSITLRAAASARANGNRGSWRAEDTIGEWASGGGAGGAILLEAPRVDVAGRLEANGGGGGSNPRADGGGAGSIGDDPNGQAASDTTLPPGDPAANSPAGGGGGAGFITIRARACTMTGMLSPTWKSGCANVLAAP